MTLNDLILEINLKIQRNFEYIKLHNEIHDFFLILSTNLKTIKDEFKSQENKTKFETKYY